MNTITIYRINETDCTIEIAQSVKDNEEDIHGAVLNARTLTFDELLRQHTVFKNNTEPLDVFRDRIHSCLRVSRSIEVSTDDMVGRFVDKHGENIFFRGFVSSVIEKYEEERLLLTKPTDVTVMRIRKKQIQNDISERINTFFDENLKRICSDAYFDYHMTVSGFSVQPMRTVTASDEYSFNVFHESDNALTVLLAEIGQIVHRNKWVSCECGFCNKIFLSAEGDVCCKSEQCRSAHEKQKKAVYKEYSAEYSKEKNNYDAYVRRYKKKLVDAKIDIKYPGVFDEFEQAKKEKQDAMEALKKRLIRNGLPIDEMVELGQRYKAEIKAMVDKILEQYNN